MSTATARSSSSWLVVAAAKRVLGLGLGGRLGVGDRLKRRARAPAALRRGRARARAPRRERASVARRARLGGRDLGDRLAPARGAPRSRAWAQALAGSARAGVLRPPPARAEVPVLAPAPRPRPARARASGSGSGSGSGPARARRSGWEPLPRSRPALRSASPSFPAAGSSFTVPLTRSPSQTTVVSGSRRVILISPNSPRCSASASRSLTSAQSSGGGLHRAFASWCSSLIRARFAQPAGPPP